MKQQIQPLSFNAYCSFDSFSSSQQSTGRSCKQRAPRVFWTQEESDFLRQLRQDRDLPFTQITVILNNRFGTHKTPAMVQQRWGRVIAPGIVKGKWSSEEDKNLVELVSRYQGDYRLVQRNFNGRTLMQIKRRAASLGLIQH